MEVQQVAATKTAGEKAACCSAPRSETSDFEQPLVQLQRLGNRAIGRFVQAKLGISTPDDPLEHEADRVADEVMRMPDPAAAEEKKIADGARIGPSLQRMCDGCAEQEENRQVGEPGGSIQRKALRTSPHFAGSSQQTQVSVAAGGGQPLPGAARAFFEPRFGYDLNQVRVHTGAQASESARSINALAYTLGHDIVFADGHYSAESSSGQRLLAHELAHVIQQDQNPQPLIQRYTPTEIATCPCLDWSIARMLAVANSMAVGGTFTGRTYASRFMGHFLQGGTYDEFVPFNDFAADAGAQTALTSVNGRVANQFLADADAIACGTSASGLSESASQSGYMTHGTDLFYAMGGFTLTAAATGTVRKNCDSNAVCTGIEAQIDILYRVNDLYDWKVDPGGCTPTTGETGCTANMKTVTLPVFGLICDECLNRLAIHNWATEFMVKVRGRASSYTVSGPCGFRNPTTAPSARENQGRDP